MGRVCSSGHPYPLGRFQNLEFSALNQLRIPRCVKLNAHQPIVKVHGFCEANQRAFEACIYFRTRSQRPSFRVTMLKVSRRAAQDRFRLIIRLIYRD